MDRKHRIIISALLLIAPAVAIFLGYYHLILLAVMFVGLSMYTFGDEYYLVKLRDSRLYKLSLLFAVFMGVFSYHALKGLVGLEEVILTLLKYWPFLVCYVGFVSVKSVFEIKYNIKGRRTIVDQ